MPLHLQLQPIVAVSLLVMSACTRAPSSSSSSDAGLSNALSAESGVGSSTTKSTIDPARELALLAQGAAAPTASTRRMISNPAAASSSAHARAGSADVVGADGFPGNALSGMTARSKLMPLATSGARCAPCFFNGRCVLLTEGDPSTACCDYAGGKTADAWTTGGAGNLGHAAECLALILEASPSSTKLLPRAKSDESCRECFFNARCQLLVEGESAAPCCDYAHGKTAGAWRDDRMAATCLATEARTP